MERSGDGPAGPAGHQRQASARTADGARDPRKGELREGWSGRLAGDGFIEGVAEALGAVEVVGLALGAIAVAVGVPLLLMLAGAALAARLDRKARAALGQPRGALWAAIAVPGVLLLATMVVTGTGVVSYEALRHGHPLGVTLAIAGALATLVTLGWHAWRRRGARA